MYLDLWIEFSRFKLLSSIALILLIQKCPNCVHWLHTYMFVFFSDHEAKNDIESVELGYQVDYVN